MGNFVGTKTELKVFLQFVNRGYPVYLPLFEGRVDCIIDTADGAKRIQIKKAKPKRVRESRHQQVSGSLCRKGSKRKKVPYGDSIDFFIFEKDDIFFVVPKDLTDNKHNISLNKFRDAWNLLPEPVNSLPEEIKQDEEYFLQLGFLVK